MTSLLSTSSPLAHARASLSRYLGLSSRSCLSAALSIYVPPNLCVCRPISVSITLPITQNFCPSFYCHMCCLFSCICPSFVGYSVHHWLTQRCRASARRIATSTSYGSSAARTSSSRWRAAACLSTMSALSRVMPRKQRLAASRPPVPHFQPASQTLFLQRGA